MIYDLHDQLENGGALVHSYLMCGATAHDWFSRSTVSCGRGERHERSGPVVNTQALLPTYSLTELIDKTHPNMVVVELGEKLEPDHSGWVRQEVHALAGKDRGEPRSRRLGRGRPGDEKQAALSDDGCRASKS